MERFSCLVIGQRSTNRRAALYTLLLSFLTLKLLIYLFLSFAVTAFAICFRMRQYLNGESHPPSALPPRKDLPSVQCWGFFVANGLRNNFFGNEAIDATARKEVIAS